MSELVKQSWMPLAWGEFGEAEIPGPKDNPRIVEYHAATTYKATADEVPWCSSFVNFVLQSAGFKTTRSARARSWQDWAAEVEPKYGSIVVMRRGNNPSQGHVGFYVGRIKRNGLILVLGGNQGDTVSVVGFREDRVLTYRWPTEDQVNYF